jgi:hypothetical protein
LPFCRSFVYQYGGFSIAVDARHQFLDQTTYPVAFLLAEASRLELLFEFLAPRFQRGHLGNPILGAIGAGIEIADRQAQLHAAQLQNAVDIPGLRGLGIVDRECGDVFLVQALDLCGAKDEAGDGCFHGYWIFPGNESLPIIRPV